MLGKPAFNDIKEGIITAPLVFGLIDHYQSDSKQKFTEFNRIILSQFENKERDVPLGVELLFESNGIELADKLSIDHINASLGELSSMQGEHGAVVDVSQDQHAMALIGLALKVKTRKY